MQIISLRTRSYRSWKINDRPVNKTAQERHKKIEQFIQLRSEGCCEATALAVIGIKRSTLYRWKRLYEQRGDPGLEPGSKRPHKKREAMWSPELERKVLHYRKRYPLWGKKKIATLLRREDNLAISDSTVGRILAKLVNRNKVYPVRFYHGKTSTPKKRKFNSHAKRWKKDMKAKKAGEMVQMDHMSVSVNSMLSIKHFEATCPITKVTIAKAYTGASSRTASVFLDAVLDELPFKVKSIQVDGGSEFMRVLKSKDTD